MFMFPLKNLAPKGFKNMALIVLIWRLLLGSILGFAFCLHNQPNNDGNKNDKETIVLLE